MDIFKNAIEKSLNNILEKSDNKDLNIEQLIETPKQIDMGNYAIVCFRLSKILHKNPNEIANILKAEFENDETINDLFEKIEVVNGYINFYVKKEKFAKYIIENKDDILKEKYNIGNGKNVVIDYSSPNVAKDFHIGHLRTTLIGFALYNIYKKLGYNIKSINYLGDYGTQFGMLINATRRFDIDLDNCQNPIEELTKIYVKINELAKNDENIMNECRDDFKKLEQGDPYCKEVYEKIKTISIAEFNKVYDMLGITFDDWNGESYFIDKMDEPVQILEKNNKLTISDGATIVDLLPDGIDTPLIVKKSNGSSTYATRDLASILYRARKYNYDKSIYVTSNEQTLHFKQVFTTAKYLDLDEKYVKGLEHVSYGMVLLPTGKMSTRGGNVVKLKDLFEMAIKRASEVLQSRENLENKEDIATKVGIGAVIFNDLSTSRNKDEIFNLDDILNFQGETGPYIQYTFVRIKSILDKYKNEKGKINYSYLTDQNSQEILSQILIYEDILKQAIDKSEPSILARFILNLAKLFSNYYNNTRILSENEDETKTRIELIKLVKYVIEDGTSIMGIHMPDKM